MPEFKYKQFEKFRGKYQLLYVTGTVSSIESNDLWLRISGAVVDVDSPDGLEQITVDLQNFAMRCFSEEAKKPPYNRVDALTKGEQVELLLREAYLRPGNNGDMQKPVPAFAVAIATEKMKQEGICYISDDAKKRLHYRPLRKKEKVKL
jgi:hypothetical protein